MKVRHALLCVLIPILVIIVGCSQPSATANNADIEKRLTELESDFDSYTEYMASRTMAVLDVTSSSYVYIQTRAGDFFLSIEKVEPYLDGFKVSLKVGNPSNVTYKGMEIAANWGTDYFELNKRPEIEPGQLAPSPAKTYNFTNDFPPGRWTRLELIVPSVDASKFKYLQLTMFPETIRFQN